MGFPVQLPMEYQIQAAATLTSGLKRGEIMTVNHNGMFWQTD